MVEAITFVFIAIIAAATSFVKTRSGMSWSYASHTLRKKLKSWHCRSKKKCQLSEGGNQGEVRHSKKKNKRGRGKKAGTPPENCMIILAQKVGFPLLATLLSDFSSGVSQTDWIVWEKGMPYVT